MQKITTELKLNTGGLLEFITLKMISKRTYSIHEIFEGLSFVGFKTPMNSLYPLLSKFRNKGFVLNGYEESETGFSLKTYDLTEKGRKHLTALRSDWKRLNLLIASL